ncbi:DUF6615 family protein [Mucilaginibacter sp. CAU 1740]|uniref:DUF6615 family protein n=1 Tax=Mucilaginibacter sp. CAU 1740 TaxID=3140365 RepID=UPI00325B733B
MSSALCQTFKELATDTFRLISHSRAVAYQLKEESFTDFNLIRLKIMHPDEVKIKAFTRIEEGVTGADWEWWLGDQYNRWIGFRVQAKIIAAEADEFKHLHYKGKASIPQCEKLILQAAANPTYPCIPLYCLYLTRSPGAGLPGSDVPLYGCSLLSAFKVRGHRAAGETRLSILWPDLKPWHTLVCFGDQQSFSDHIIRQATNYFLADDNASGQYLLTEPPPYVQQLLNSDSGQIDLPAKSLDLAGVMILRQEQKRPR